MLMFAIQFQFSLSICLFTYFISIYIKNIIAHATRKEYQNKNRKAVVSNLKG